MDPDVIIVGGGLAGLATAWHLAPHRSVQVLERRQAPGLEATAQNAGLVRRLGEDPVERILAMRTSAWMRAPGPSWTTPPPARAVGAVLGLAVDPFHLNDAAAHLRAQGVRVEEVDQPAAHAPALAGAPLHRAWWVPDELVAEPAALVQGFVAGMQAAGGEIACGAQVRDLWVEGGRVVGVRTDREDLRSGCVVLAAGAWSAALAATHVRRRLVPLRRHIALTQAHPASSPDHPWAWIDDVGLYVRPEGSGWLLCGCDEAAEPVPTEAESRGDLTEDHVAWLSEKVCQYLPALSEVTWDHGWSGLRTFAPDRRPILGPDPDLPGLHWAAGLGGFGVTCSYGVGEVVASWIRGLDTPWLAPRFVSPARRVLSRWPIRPDGTLRGAKLITTA